jgi:2,3-bisphosphoglycerate-dependent phosphoglycerate mutase
VLRLRGLVDTLAGMYNLVLLRHGHSLWNQENRFTGWYDVDLAPEGVEEAKHGGQMLAKAGILPDVVHTSLLRRAIRTSTLALEHCDRMWIPVKRSWRLNERHYGDLQGKDKAETLAEFGEEKFMIWRRSFDVPPPAVALDSPHHPLNDARYSALDPKVLPATEALSDVLVRMLPYWEDAIIPDLRANKTVLVAAHGNSLRALVMHLDGLTREQVVALNIPTGIPLQYTLDKNLKPISSAYLDPEAARIAAEKVANQGKK